MDNLIIKSFLPEIFFSLAILFQLVFNAKLINNIKFNFPIINKEILINKEGAIIYINKILNIMKRLINYK